MKITDYYSLDNIVTWIKIILYALFRPKCFVKEIESKNNSELLAQYSFYFILTTAFYIFINVDFQKESLLKQSTFDLLINSFGFLSILITTIILCKTERNKKLKIAFLYFLAIIFALFPIQILLKAAFYGMEDYFYELVNSIITVTSFIYINYIVVIILKSGWKSIILFLSLSYLILNVLLLGTAFFRFDKYAPQYVNDRILIEYVDLYNSLNCQDEIPTALTYMGYKDDFKFGFALWNLRDTTSTKTDLPKMDLYRKQLDENIKMIDEKQFSFYRNKAIALEYKHYFNIIQKTIEQVHMYPTDLREYGYKLDFMGLPVDSILVFTKQIEIDCIIAERSKLVEYYNKFMDSKTKSRYPHEIIYRLQYAPSILIMKIFRNKEDYQ
jgi:hypothetical protein